MAWMGVTHVEELNVLLEARLVETGSRCKEVEWRGHGC